MSKATTVACLLLLGLHSPALPSQEPQDPDPPRATARLPVKVIAGRLVVRCEASTRTKRLPFSLLIDFDRPVGLELHNRAAQGLELERHGNELTLHFPGMDIPVRGRGQGDHEFLEDFTRYYSTDLGDVPLVGAIGARLLHRYAVTLDLGNQTILLASPPPEGSEPAPAPDGAMEIPFSLINHQIWFRVRDEGDLRGAMVLATSHYDTLLAREIAEARGRPAGDIGKVWLQDIEITASVALRPERLSLAHTDTVAGALGINFLLDYRVEIDLPGRRAFFVQTRTPRFPQGDLNYFRALARDEPEAIIAWADGHPHHRFRREATDRLLLMQLDRDADDGEMRQALDLWDQARLPDLKSTEALRGMKMLSEMGRVDLAIELGGLGIRGGRADRYPESVHQIHARLGEWLLARGENQRAWEHLLSAAFGLPEDGRISLLLGNFYEREGRLDRALSRYLQAVLKPESGTAAVRALEEFRKRMPDLSVDRIDEMLEGRTYNFAPATVYEAPGDRPAPNRTVLVELFTNPELGRFMGGQWISLATGGAMGLEGLLAYYPRERLVALNWHLDRPEPSAVMIEAGLERARSMGLGPDVMLVNGAARGPGAARDRDAETVFETNRTLVDAALTERSPYTLSISAETEDGTIRGTVTVEGRGEVHDRVHLVLAERGVLCPGKGLVVVHRMVARAAILGGSEGIPYRPGNDRMEVPFSIDLDEIARANQEFLDRYEREGRGTPPRMSARIDPRQASLVAFIRDRLSGEIWQAAQRDLGPPKEKQ